MISEFRILLTFLYSEIKSINTKIAPESNIVPLTDRSLILDDNLSILQKSKRAKRVKIYNISHIKKRKLKIMGYVMKKIKCLFKPDNSGEDSGEDSG